MEMRALLIGCDDHELAALEELGFIAEQLRGAGSDAELIEKQISKWLKWPRTQANILEELESLFRGATDCYQIVVLGRNSPNVCTDAVERVMTSRIASVATFLQLTDLDDTNFSEDETKPHIVSLATIRGAEGIDEFRHRLAAKRNAVQAFINLHEHAYATVSRAAIFVGILAAAISSVAGKFIELVFDSFKSTNDGANWLRILFFILAASAIVVWGVCAVVRFRRERLAKGKSPKVEMASKNPATEVGSA